VLHDASTTASLVVNLSHLLDGITTSGSLYSAVSSRFSRLRTSRPGGDEAVSRTISAVGLDEITQLGYHRTNITLQLLKNSQPVLYRPAPDLERSVSGERVAPNQCTRIAKRRFYNGYTLANKWVIVAAIASPQSRNFKRYDVYKL
jgi:hypothetical protein